MCCTWAARYRTPTDAGACLAHSLSGDSGLAMLFVELLTVKTRNLPVKVVVFNNSSLGMARLEMMAAGVPRSGPTTTRSTTPPSPPRSASPPAG
jgi:thiamine pyrophosphate-dependent acetolactate synthase large subunit-like protein